MQQTHVGVVRGRSFETTEDRSVVCIAIKHNAMKGDLVRFLHRELPCTRLTGTQWGNSS